MSRLFFLPVSLVAAFAAAVIASPVAAVADEAEVFGWSGIRIVA